jgi:integrase
MLTGRLDTSSTPYVFASRERKPYLSTSINHLHQAACSQKAEVTRRPLFPKDFVLHSLRHTMSTRLGKSEVDAFTIMRIGGHSSIVVLQRYIHPTPEAVECAFERLQLSGTEVEFDAKRLPPATVSATVAGRPAASCLKGL